MALAGQLSPPTNAGAVTAGVGCARMGGSGQRSMKQAQVPDAGGRGFGSVETCPWQDRALGSWGRAFPCFTGKAETWVIEVS